jgi:hypothetical protein
MTTRRARHPSRTSLGERAGRAARFADVSPGSGAGVLVGARGRWRPGLAYHAGTLLALELHGVRAATAVSVTGTSAGSIATAVPAAGATVEDLAAHSVGAAPREQVHATHELIRAADSRRVRLDVHALGQLFDLRRVLTTSKASSGVIRSLHQVVFGLSDDVSGGEGLVQDLI